MKDNKKKNNIKPAEKSIPVENVTSSDKTEATESTEKTGHTDKVSYKTVDNKNAIKKIGNKRLKTRIKFGVTILICAGIIGLAIALIDFYVLNPTQRNVSISVEFNYDGSAQNQMPNDEPFTIDGIKNDEIIESALADLGKKDSYSTESIRNSMSIMGEYPEDVIERISEYTSVYEFVDESTDEIKATNDVHKHNYYPTVYKITLYDDFNTKASESEMEQILEKIVEKYKEYFLKRYVFVYSYDNTEEILGLEDLDYRLQLSYIRGKSDALQSYAKQLYNKQQNFTYNGQNFNDFYVKCYDVERNIISRLEAVIMLKAYSKNPERLLNLYDYRISLLSNELKNQKIKLTEIQRIIDNYELDDTLYIMSGDSVVTVGSKATGTYEELTSKRISINNRITAINEQIAKNQEYIDDIKKAQQGDSYLETVKTDIDEANSKITQLETEFANMVQAYNDYLITADDIDFTDMKFTSPSILSGSFIKRAIKFAAPICLLAFIIFCAVMISDEKKRVQA